VVGPQAEAYARGAIAGGLAHQQVISALDSEEAATALKPMLREGDAVLVKGSHFMGLERLVAALSGKAGA
jgi:UDP-N-acetylmuramoyl-tripeptide--D-alanyl-D-alanine ligase